MPVLITLKAIGTAVTLVVTYIICRHLVIRWKLRAFNGPIPLPLFGNCYTADAFFFLKYLVTLRKRYGQVFTYWAFTKPHIVVCDPVIVRRVLSDNKTFYRGSEYTAFGRGLITSNGDQHAKDRALLASVFSRQNVARYTGLMNALADEALDHELMSSCSETNHSRVANIHEFFGRLALRTFMSFTVGSNYKEDPRFELEICHSIADAASAVGRLITVGLPMWSWRPGVKQIQKCRDCVLRDFDSFVEQRKAVPVEQRPHDVLSVMLADGLLNNTDMKDHYMTLLCAGHDTTAYMSAYMCYLLAQYPKIQDRVVAEINNQLGERVDITADDVMQMAYLTCVMQETMRLYSIIPCVTRTSSEEVVVKEVGVTIPRGANVMIPMFLVNRDPSIWDSPGEFNPERFVNTTTVRAPATPGEGGAGGSDWSSARNGFFPFGYGARTCVGSSLAQMQSMIFVCKLLRRFKIQPDPGFKLSILSGVSLTTANGINIMLKRRESGK